jgi:cytochrome b subunit of formate dehydrogenase
MNLDNGACGPEGCVIDGTVDAGRSIFVLVVVLTTSMMLLTGVVLWRTILKNL